MPAVRPPTPRAFLAIPCVVAATIIAATAAMIAAAFSPRGRAVDFITYWWARFIALVSGLEVSASGMERVPAGRSCVVVSNHQSHLDAIALVLSSPVPLRMLGKKSLFRIPIFGWGMRMAGHIPIDRFQGRTDFEALQRSCRSLYELGRSISIFPEGTRSSDGRLLPFKQGAFHIARNLGLPIVPASVRDTRTVLPARTFRFRKGRATVTWHEPIDPHEMSVEDLAERVRGIIEEDLE